MTDERVWINRIKKGESHHFSLLYDAHKERLFHLCYRFTGNHHDAEEQLQEVFIRLIQKIDRFEGKSSFVTWSHRVATNHLLNFKRDNKASAEQALESVDEPLTRDRDGSLKLMLQKAVNALPDGFRKVFLLHDKEGYRHDEIGDMLGISAATSRSQLARARLALRKSLAHKRPGAEVCV